MGGQTITESQTYLLKWNLHTSNLVEILDALLKRESYVDCTIVVDDHVQFKAHRVVLAASSPYFQSILQDVPMDHCSIIFPDVKSFEMHALLEYMYTGEVNVSQSLIPKIMRIAEQLEVKGLCDMSDLKEKFNKFDDLPYPPLQPPSTPKYAQTTSSDQKTSSPQISTTSNNITSAAQSSSSSPPYNYRSPYQSMYAKSPNAGPSMVGDKHQPASWPNIPSATAAAMLSSVYETATDMNPLKRKKLSSISSMIMNRDTPILRNVLAQSHSADSSQPMPLVCSPHIKGEKSEKHYNAASNNYSGNEYSSEKKPSKYDEPHSPFTDRSFDDESMEYPANYTGETRLSYGGSQPNQKPEWKRYKQYTRNDILQAIECVRNGMSALQASRKYGVPSRTLYDKVKKMGITNGRPSMNRSLKRSPSSVGNSAAFPYGLNGANHSYGQAEHILSSIQDHGDRDKDLQHQDNRIQRSIPNAAAAALLDPAFLQQAFENRGGDIAGREALHAMALAAAAHAAVNGMSSPVTNGIARSPSPGQRALYDCGNSREREMKMELVDRERELERERQMELDEKINRPSENASRDDSHEEDGDDKRESSAMPDTDEQDRVEDLSVCRKEAVHNRNSYSLQNGGSSVIVPPRTKLPGCDIDAFSVKREIVADDPRD